MFSKLRSAFVGLLVIAASTVAVPVATAVGAPSPSSAQVGPVAQTVVSPMTTPTWSNTNIVAVSSGFKGSCAIQGTGPTSTSGTLFCWGSGPIVGDGSNNSSNVPVAVSATAGFANTAVTAVAVGEGHACAIEAGMLWCWGSAYLANQWGVLGAGVASSLTPILVSANGDFDNDGAAGDAVTAVAAAYAVTCAIEGGQTFCWGNNNSDNLGVGPNASSPINEPTRVRDSATPEFQAATATELSVGFFHVCATASTSVYCWGFNNEGRLGDGSTTFSNAPLKAAQGGFATANANVSGLDLGWNHSCALQGGIVRCWGEGTYNQLGTGNTSHVSSPTDVGSGNGFTNAGNVSAVSAGERHTCAIESGTVYCWGLNGSGRLGDGSTTDAASPVAVSTSDVPGFNNTAVTAVSAGSQHTCAIENKVVYCWGSNTDNQLGDGASMTQLKPVRVFVTSAPAAPTISVRTGASGELNVDVTKPNDGGSTITSYEYTIDNEATWAAVAFSNTNFQTITISGLTDGTQYSVKVRAVNAIGNGAASAAATGTPTAMQNNPNPNPNPNQPPPCVTGAPTIGGTNPTLDTSFGTGGAIAFATTGIDNVLQGGVATSDGNLVVAESVEVSGDPVIKFRKYSPTGTLVSSFGTGGVLTIDKSSGTSSENADEIAELSDGSLIVTYAVRTFGMSSSTQQYLLKLTSNGAIDTSFGTNGYGTIPASSNSNVRNLEVLTNGSVIVLVSTYGQGASINELKKFTSTGVADSAFGTSGTLTLSQSEYNFAVNSADSILVGGSTGTSPSSATVKKYTSAGVLDTAWATSGVLSLSWVGNQGDNLSVMTVATDAGNKIYVAVRASANQSMNSTSKLFRLLADGTNDSSFGSGTLLSSASSPYVVDILVLADGNVVPTSMNMGMNPEVGVSMVSSSGVLDSSHATNTASLLFGDCALSDARIAQLSTGEVLAFGSTYVMGASSGDSTGSLWKLNFSGVAGGGGSNVDTPSTPATPAVDTPSTPATPAADTPSTPATPAAVPTLVTSANAAALVRAPGSESIIINGEEVVIESKTVSIPAARTPAAQRTAAQVKSIQQAGAALLQQFLASLPSGATSNVTVVNTATGAVMQNLVFDANGNSVNVPVEDIVFLDGPQLSLMIGSNNANITADGKYQVGAGAIVGVTGSGLGAGADGEIVAMSTPTLLANFQTTAAGDFNKSATLPSSIGVGDHTLVVATGTTYAMMGIRVVPAALPTTGSSTENVVIIALFTLVVGALFFRGRRISLI